MMNVKNLITGVVLVCSTACVYAADGLEGQLDNLNEQLNQVLSNAAKDDSTLISVSIKKDGKYIRVFSSRKDLLGEPIPEKVFTELEKNKTYQSGKYDAGGKVCETGLFKSYENGNYVIGIATGCK